MVTLTGVVNRPIEVHQPLCLGLVSVESIVELNWTLGYKESDRILSRVAKQLLSIELELSGYCHCTMGERRICRDDVGINGTSRRSNPASINYGYKIRASGCDLRFGNNLLGWRINA